MTYNEWLEIEVKRLNNENDNIKHFFSYDELELLNEITRLKDEKTILNHKLSIQLEENTKYRIDEHKKLKHRLSHLARTNTDLQNDLFSEQLLQDETDDYIDKLKNELFNAYLEIESDNVNIQLSHYHIKKLLQIIDEHTLINPYTN